MENIVRELALRCRLENAPLDTTVPLLLPLPRQPAVVPTEGTVQVATSAPRGRRTPTPAPRAGTVPVITSVPPSTNAMPVTTATDRQYLQAQQMVSQVSVARVR